MAHRTVHTGSGRQLGLSGIGNAEAPRLVVLFHPTPGAGGFDPNPTVSNTSNIHLLTPDRPGYGSSDPLPDGVTPTIGSHVDDVAEYLRHAESFALASSGVSFGSVGVIGWGGGGRYALAFAARHRAFVDKVVLVGTASPEHGPAPSGILEATAIPERATMASLLTSLEATDRSALTPLGVVPGDPRLELPGLPQRLGHMLGDAYRQGMAGVATDLLAAQDGSWFARLGAITARTWLLYGAADGYAGREDGEWFRARIPNAQLDIVDGSSTLAIASEWERIVAYLEPERGDDAETPRGGTSS